MCLHPFIYIADFQVVTGDRNDTVILTKSSILKNDNLLLKSLRTKHKTCAIL